MNEQTVVLEHSAQAERVAASPSNFRWLVLAASCMSVIAFQSSAMSYGPLLGEIARNLGIGLAQAVTLMSMFMLFAAISFFAAGPLCDRYGVATVIAISPLLSAAPGTAIFWLGHSFSAILVIRAVQGCAVGFAMAGMAPLVLRWFPAHQRGLALGIPGACNPLGVIIGVLAAPALYRATASWQHSIVYLSILSWVALLSCLVVFKFAQPFAPPAQAAPQNTTTAALFRSALRWPFTWIGVLITFAVNWIMQSVFSLSPSYFAEAKPLGLGFGPLGAGQWMGVVQIAAIVGPIVGGLLLDKVFHGRARGVLAIAFLLAFSYCGLQFHSVCDNRFFFVGCLALAGAGIGMLFPFVQSEISELYDHSIVGSMNGVWLGVGAFGGSAGLFASAAALRQTGSYVLPIQIICVAAALGMLLCAIRPRVAGR